VLQYGSAVHPDESVTTYTLVVNPVAGKGHAARLIRPLRLEFERRGIEFTLIETHAPGDATSAARDAVTSVVVAVGGDGTLNEVANGLAGSSKALGIIPAGSGNDFIKSIGITRNVQNAVEVLLRGARRRIDLGKVVCSEGNAPQGRLFINGVGVGFDAAVAVRTRSIPYLSGTALYIAGVLQTLAHYTPPEFHLSMNHTSVSSSNLLIAIGNGRCAGGGFYLTPDAQVDDGLFDICVIEKKTVPEIIRLMPRVMRGKHFDIPGVKFFKEKRLHIFADSEFSVHADGEIIGEGVHEVALEVMPAALDIIAPEAGNLNTK
jgi:YegS/Rv2252/BmrU family lipid kinase